jgi:hypothetical protein
MCPFPAAHTWVHSTPGYTIWTGLPLRRFAARRFGPGLGVRDGHVFTTGWGEPIYPDTVTSLMTKLIAAHNEPDDGPGPGTLFPTPGYTTCGTSTPRPCCCPASRSMSSRQGWVTRTQPSRFGLRSRHPHRRDRRRGHLRPGRQDRLSPAARTPLLARPLTKEPLP